MNSYNKHYLRCDKYKFLNIYYPSITNRIMSGKKIDFGVHKFGLMCVTEKLHGGYKKGRLLGQIVENFWFFNIGQALKCGKLRLFNSFNRVFNNFKNFQRVFSTVQKNSCYRFLTVCNLFAWKLKKYDNRQLDKNPAEKLVVLHFYKSYKMWYNKDSIFNILI